MVVYMYIWYRYTRRIGGVGVYLVLTCPTTGRSVPTTHTRTHSRLPLLAHRDRRQALQYQVGHSFIVASRLFQAVLYTYYIRTLHTPRYSFDQTVEEDALEKALLFEEEQAQRAAALAAGGEHPPVDRHLNVRCHALLSTQLAPFHFHSSPGKPDLSDDRKALLRMAEAKWRQQHAAKMNALRDFLLNQMRHAVRTPPDSDVLIGFTIIGVDV